MTNILRSSPSPRPCDCICDCYHHNPSTMTSRADHLRSCLGCKFVQRAKEFTQRGCPNCEAILEMMQDTDQVIRCTTSNYDGLIALIKPEESWVAKWQRIEKRVPGLYAVKTEGNLPQDLQERMRGGG